jgi:hypothetical protein
MDPMSFFIHWLSFDQVKPRDNSGKAFLKTILSVDHLDIVPARTVANGTKS